MTPDVADDPRVAPLAEALRSTGLSLTHQGASQASIALLAILDRGPLAVGPGKTCQPEGHDAHDPYRPVIHLDEPGDDVWECRRCGQRLR